MARDHLVKSEVLRMLHEGWVLKSGPFGAWLEHDDDEKMRWNQNNVHGNSFNALIEGGHVKVKKGLGVMFVWELA